MAEKTYWTLPDAPSELIEEEDFPLYLGPRVVVGVLLVGSAQMYLYGSVSLVLDLLAQTQQLLRQAGAADAPVALLRGWN